MAKVHLIQKRLAKIRRAKAGLEHIQPAIDDLRKEVEEAKANGQICIHLQHQLAALIRNKRKLESKLEMPAQPPVPKKRKVIMWRPGMSNEPKPKTKRQPAEWYPVRLVQGGAPGLRSRKGR